MEHHRQLNLLIAHRIEEIKDLFNDTGSMLTLANTYLHADDFQTATNWILRAFLRKRMNDEEIKTGQFFSDFFKNARIHMEESLLIPFLENATPYVGEATKRSLPWLTEGIEGKFTPQDTISLYAQQIATFIMQNSEQS